MRELNRLREQVVVWQEIGRALDDAGELATLDDEGMRDLSSWDGLLQLDDEDDDPELAPTPEELLADEGPYDPLPGFEEA